MFSYRITLSYGAGQCHCSWGDRSRHVHGYRLVLTVTLCSPDFLVRYRIGEAFVHLSLPEVQERIERDLSELANEIERLGHDRDSVNKRMVQLKSLLYAKFGKTINLEKE